MKDFQEVINEGFFKKKSYADRLKEKLPLYEPDAKKDGSVGFSVGLRNPEEAKKRLVSSFGAVLGNNTIKTMASKAIKTFPIVISDNIDPETAVLIKKTTEEQYAQYVELLIANQIIDAEDFVTANNDLGNVAIQAVDNISGPDFSKRQGLGSKLANGDISLNKIAKNDMLYNIMREDSMAFEIDDMFAKAILESAVVLPSDKADLFIDYLAENENIFSGIQLLEMSEQGFKITKQALEVEIEQLNADLKEAREKNNAVEVRRLEAEIVSVKNELDELIRKHSVFTKKDREPELPELPPNPFENFEKRFQNNFEKAFSNSFYNQDVSDVLNKNHWLKDRFGKANFLLQAKRISGAEYISYVNDHLGIPIPEKIKKDLVLRVLTPVKDGEDGFTKEDIERISKNKMLRKNSHLIEKIKVKDWLNSAKTHSKGAAAVGSSIGLVTLITAGSLFGLAAAIPYLGGATAISLYKKNKELKLKNSLALADTDKKVEPWRRVAQLIDQLDAQLRDSKSTYFRNNPHEAKSDEEKKLALQFKIGDTKTTISSKELSDAIAACNTSLKSNEIRDFKLSSPLVKITEDEIYENYNIIQIAPVRINLEESLKELAISHNELMEEDSEYRAEVLSEAFIGSTKPIETTFEIKPIQKYKFDPSAPPEIEVVPAFSLRQRKAYGSVEYDTRQIQDRRYNQPLIMKINFRERFSDGTFSDNEMTAVIGILGVVTRVPSEEMVEILKSNIDNETLKGILRPLESKSQTNITDLLGLAKRSKNKMISDEIWANLERVAKLSLINKMRGKKDNNIANAHIIFSQKEVDQIKTELNVDYLRDKKLLSRLMKRYNAFSIMIANDIGEKLYIFDDLDAIGTNVIPYSAIRGKGTTDQLSAALMKISDRR